MFAGLIVLFVLFSVLLTVGGIYLFASGLTARGHMPAASGREA